MFEYGNNNQNMFNNDLSNLGCPEETICPKCGLSLLEVQKTGIVGCLNCFKVFDNEIKRIILKKQGNINHIGKISSKHFSRIKLKEKIAQLEESKNLAIKNENFILAESLKNQIEKLKGEF